MDFDIPRWQLWIVFVYYKPSVTAHCLALIQTHTWFPHKSWKFPQSWVQADTQNIFHPIMIHFSIKDLKLELGIAV